VGQDGFSKLRKQTMVEIRGLIGGPPQAARQELSVASQKCR
jgi:hypothetical protein